MGSKFELRAFQATVGVLLLIPIAAGLAGGLGGLEALATLFGADARVAVGPSLRNHLRAVCWGFFTIAPIVIWTLRSLRERASGFRVIVVTLIFAGFARLTGWLVDGAPGAVPLAIMILELGGLPVLLLWHARLVARAAG